VGVEKHENPVNTEVRVEGGGGAPSARADVHLQPMKFWERPQRNRYCPVAHGEDCAAADKHAAVHGGPQAGADGYAPEETAAMWSPH